MRTTVVHRRPIARPADLTMPCSRPLASVQVQTLPVLRQLPAGDEMPAAAPWSTAKLGLVVSTLSALVAVVVDAATSLPTPVIVLTVVVVAFALSMRATSRRPLSHR